MSSFLWLYHNKEQFDKAKQFCKRLLRSEVNSKHGVTIFADFPSSSKSPELNIKRSPVLRQYFGENLQFKDQSRYVLRPTYGISGGSSSTTVGHDIRFVKTREMDNNLLSIGRSLQDYILNTTHMKKRFNKKQLSILERKSFNHCTVLIYFTDEGDAMKKVSTLGKHCDCNYDIQGEFQEESNSQMENTPTISLSLGESRELQLFRRYGVISKTSQRLVWKEDESFKQSVSLSDGSVFVLHPTDEKPTLVADENGNTTQVQFQHGDIRFKGALSMGLVFRIVTKSRYYDTRNDTVCLSAKDYGNLDNERKNHQNIDQKMSSVDHDYVQEMFRELSDIIV